MLPDYRAALERARERFEQIHRDRTERDKVMAQATTAIAEIDVALAASPAPVGDGGELPFEAVEAAGRSLHRSDSRKRPASARAWDQLGKAARNRYLGNAAYALRAAQPHLIAADGGGRSDGQ